MFARKLPIDPRPLRSASASPHRVIVIGDESLRSRAEPWLAGLDAAIQFVDWADGVSEHHGADLIGVVVLGEPPTTEAWTFVRDLNETLERPAGARIVPVAVLLDGEVPDRIARKLYLNGASAVFRLDARAELLDVERVDELLPRLFASPAEGATPLRVPDRRLERFVDAAVERAVDEPDEVQTRVEKGQVVVAGSVSSHDELRRLARAIRQCPGTRKLENYAVIE